MEKIGLIANEFIPNLRTLVKNLEEISNASLRIGYCRSLAALKERSDSITHTDIQWALKNGIAHPDREQELLRNCDLLLVYTGINSDSLTLPLMSSRTTFLIPETNVTKNNLRDWISLARQYGTRFGYCLPGVLADNDDEASLIDLAEEIICFYRVYVN